MSRNPLTDPAYFHASKPAAAPVAPAEPAAAEPPPPRVRSIRSAPRPRAASKKKT